MAHRIEVSPAAARQLKKLDPAVLLQIVAKIEALADDPRPHGCEKLVGYDELYRTRVGRFRIVYAVEDHLVLVLILKVADRAEVYRRIRQSDLDFLRRLLGE